MWKRLTESKKDLCTGLSQTATWLPICVPKLYLAKVVLFYLHNYIWLDPVFGSQKKLSHYMNAFFQGNASESPKISYLLWEWCSKIHVIIGLPCFLHKCSHRYIIGVIRWHLERVVSEQLEIGCSQCTQWWVPAHPTPACAAAAMSSSDRGLLRGHVTATRPGP